MIWCAQWSHCSKCVPERSGTACADVSECLPLLARQYFFPAILANVVIPSAQVRGVGQRWVDYQGPRAIVTSNFEAHLLVGPNYVVRLQNLPVPSFLIICRLIDYRLVEREIAAVCVHNKIAFPVDPKGRCPCPLYIGCKA